MHLDLYCHSSLFVFSFLSVIMAFVYKQHIHSSLCVLAGMIRTIALHMQCFELQTVGPSPESYSVMSSHLQHLGGRSLGLHWDWQTRMMANN